MIPVSFLFETIVQILVSRDDFFDILAKNTAAILRPASVIFLIENPPGETQQGRKGAGKQILILKVPSQQFEAFLQSKAEIFYVIEV